MQLPYSWGWPSSSFKNCHKWMCEPVPVPVLLAAPVACGELLLGLDTLLGLGLETLLWLGLGLATLLGLETLLETWHPSSLISSLENISSSGWLKPFKETHACGARLAAAGKKEIHIFRLKQGHRGCR